MNPAKITYPFEGADTVNSAMDDVFNIFPDHYPKLVGETDNGWVLQLEWPVVPEWYVDKGVFNQANALWGLLPHQIASYYQESKLAHRIDFVFSMFHSRAVIASVKANKRLDTVLKTIVHIDDHDDLMPSQLFPLGDTIENPFDLVSNLSFDDTKSVVSAIDKGCINMGNFLTTYLLFNPDGKLIVVNPKNKKTCGWLHTESIESPYAKGSVTQMGLYLDDKKKPGFWRYERTPKVPKSVEGTNNDKIWLDIDLDVFCNRYERDSALENKQGNLREKKIMRNKVKKIFTDLNDTLWLHRVEAISIAVSPGFFPSDYWGEIVPEVLNQITELFDHSQ